VLASRAAAEGRHCLFVAKRQTNGKGRYDRTFDSDEGGLYMSLCLKMQKQPLEIQDYPFLTGEVVRDVLQKIIKKMYCGATQNSVQVANCDRISSNLDFHIKPPNDVYLNGKKICGILMEAIPYDDDLFVIFGIGVNLTNRLRESLPMASNIEKLTGIRLEPLDLCAALTEALVKYFG